MRRLWLLTLLAFLASSCSERKGDRVLDSASEVRDTVQTEVIILPVEKVKAYQLVMDTLSTRNIHTVVEAYGEIEIPPQNQATVSTPIGAKVNQIFVKEGERVRKGQVLATVSHPDIIQIQMEYVKAYQKLQFLETDFQRQEKLQSQKVTSEKKYQETRSEYMAQKGIVKSYEQILRELHIEPKRIQDGNIIRNVPILSPIDGYVDKIFVHIGQYVNPTEAMFTILNTDHLHLLLKVFEENVSKIKPGQEIRFSTKAYPNTKMKGKIYSIGKQLDKDHRFVFVHGHISEEDQKRYPFFPGMYVSASIVTGSEPQKVLPEAAIVRKGDQTLAFVVERKENQYLFYPIEIEVLQKEADWLSVRVPPNYADKTFLLSGAYYVFAESQKEEFKTE
jgi:cobalt-zinc-cadmium efflux system membrane fusion protein